MSENIYIISIRYLQSAVCSAFSHDRDHKIYVTDVDTLHYNESVSLDGQSTFYIKNRKVVVHIPGVVVAFYRTDVFLCFFFGV
jgi:hypothetical protein